MVLRKLLGVLVLLSSAVPLSFGQAAPQAIRGGIPLDLGAGYSYFNSDWHRGRTPTLVDYPGKNWIMGYTLWADWSFYKAPGLLQGIGIEIQGRDLNFGRSSTADPNLRQVVGEGGVIYKWRRWRIVRPYGKILAGYGGMNMTTSDPNYTHDTRTVVSEALGADFVFHDHFIVRADFENQNWSDWMANHSLTPRGITVGIAWDFKQPAR
jgi:Outer membrane protein beta-barrel domain